MAAQPDLQPHATNCPHDLRYTMCQRCLNGDPTRRAGWIRYLPWGIDVEFTRLDEPRPLVPHR